MPILQLVADGGEQIAGPLRICNLHLGDEMDLLPTPAHLPEAHERNNRTDSEENPMADARTLDQQLKTIEALAVRHYPDDRLGQMTFKLEMLTQRLREYESKVQRLEVRSM